MQAYSLFVVFYVDRRYKCSLYFLLNWILTRNSKDLFDRLVLVIFLLTSSFGLCEKISNEIDSAFVFGWIANGGCFTWIGLFSNQRTTVDNGN